MNKYQIFSVQFLKEYAIHPILDSMKERTKERISIKNLDIPSITHILHMNFSNITTLYEYINDMLGKRIPTCTLKD